jgi:hypothetical protein
MEDIASLDIVGAAKALGPAVAWKPCHRRQAVLSGSSDNNLSNSTMKITGRLH